MNKELEAKILGWLPWLPWLLKRLEKELRHFDVRYPAKALNRFKALAEKLPINIVIDEGRIMADLRQLFEAPSTQQELRKFLLYLPKAAKKEASANPSYSLLLKLISKADEQVPLISLGALFTAADPEKNLRPQCVPLDLLEQADKSKGEARAKAVVRAYLEVSEWLYKPYLRRLWLLSCVIRNDWKKAPENLGNLIVQLNQRLPDHPGLVEINVGWRRNAAGHGHWEYDETDDSLILWDQKRPRTKVPVDELLAQLYRIYQISGPTLAFVAQLYLIRNFMWNTGLIDAFIVRIPHLLSSDEGRRSAAEQELIRKVMKAMERLQNYIAANSQAIAAANA
jgi:hypothetical protein